MRIRFAARKLRVPNLCFESNLNVPCWRKTLRSDQVESADPKRDALSVRNVVDTVDYVVEQVEVFEENAWPE